MVGLSGEELNHLFDTLANWNAELEALNVTDLPDWGMQP